ncbi:class I SAM-dependent methyltransferase [Bailinhaonella thermotolerans]|uniref:Class I SAM-dependent methyltransferase n=1 Tax=Bailinhaonella thermotolerans TaxID=1070861 RepID=A0A3A4AV60_9ACTN|nr:class I SAM-dependent methyltransferase [Bailinhaonella thermotolerans]RJL32591.1 class I SAM-dependent methyltransferase [Bailinhaonella thermotolerans]
MSFNHNDHYHGLLLRHVPAGARRALDVGCGTGRFARRLAARGLEVDAVDASAEVVAAARKDPAGVTFEQADITRHDLPRGRYDYVSCLASIHHVPFETVTRLRDALAPGGVLAILGCYRESTPADYAWALAAVPANAVIRLALAARADDGVPAPVTAPTMTLPEIRREGAALLPGAKIRRLLFFRYLLLHQAPA